MNHENEEDLMVQVCVTRTLPPALTLELGLERLIEAVDQLKANPPKSSTGVLRFQVRFAFFVFVNVFLFFFFFFLVRAETIILQTRPEINSM